MASTRKGNCYQGGYVNTEKTNIRVSDKDDSTIVAAFVSIFGTDKSGAIGV